MSRITAIATMALAGAALLAATSPGYAADEVIKAPAPRLVAPVAGHREVAILAGGCFWGVEGVFSHVKGVISATAGYAGGKATTATYETVSSGTTGHAESVRIIFDPTVVNYADLLQIYFSVVADPTLLNRQGPDHGTQYRSALFTLSAAQEEVARAYIAQLAAAHVYARPIVTRVEAQIGFFPAEGYHQDFMAKNPNYPYIVINDRPKVNALKRIFPLNWKA
ncbi:peptide-methionine (S)-S-oxide reductase MsrA [soil metagenome]